MLLAHYRPMVIMHPPGTDDLALAYLENAFKNSRPRDVLVDALHAAIATASNIPYMATYNYRNLLSIKRQEQMNAINMLAGYHVHLALLPPFMFLDLAEYTGEKGAIDKSIWDIKTSLGKKLEALFKLSPAHRLAYHESIVHTAAKNLGLGVLVS
jgi:hypothetical protein